MGIVATCCIKKEKCDDGPIQTSAPSNSDHLLEPERAKQVCVLVQVALTGEQLTLEVSRDCLVLELKDIIRARLGIHTICQSLMLPGSEGVLDAMDLVCLNSPSQTELIVHIDLVVSLKEVYTALQENQDQRAPSSARRCALEALLDSKCKADDSLVELLVSQLRCRNAAIRCLALKCLAQVFDSQACLPSIEKIVRDLIEHGRREARRKVRRQIAITLATSVSKDILFGMVTADSWLSRHCWQLSLGKGDEDVIGNILPWLQSGPQLRLAIKACLMRAKRGDSRVLHALLAQSSSEDAMKALCTLTKKGDEIVLSELLQSFQGTLPRQREKDVIQYLEWRKLTTICAIANRGDERAVQCVLDDMEHCMHRIAASSNCPRNSNGNAAFAHFTLCEKFSLLLWLLELFSQVAPRTTLSAQMLRDRELHIQALADPSFHDEIDEKIATKCNFLCGGLGKRRTHFQDR